MYVLSSRHPAASWGRAGLAAAPVQTQPGRRHLTYAVGDQPVPKPARTATIARDLKACVWLAPLRERPQQHGRAAHHAS